MHHGKKVANVLEASKLEACKHQLRGHQRAIIKHAERVIDGIETDKIATAYVTPGGGKTLMASIYAAMLLDAGIVDETLVLCPRDALRSQFVKGAVRRDMGIKLLLGIEGNKKVDQMSLDARHGLVATIHAVIRKPTKYIRRFSGKRLLLIIDEAHHLADDEEGGWAKTIRPLVEQAAHVLLMSGTLYRHDGEPIPFVHYDDNRDAKIHVRYDRRDALTEGAVRVVESTMLDGVYEFEHQNRTYIGNISEATTKLRVKGAIAAAVRSEDFRNEVLERAVEHWKKYRDLTGYRCRMIIIADEQKRAKDITDFLRRQGLDAMVAVSGDGSEAQKIIRRFRDKKEGDILVTVGMAYEGLDVPDCTHLVCLTRIRSWPWLEQAFARVMRPDVSSPLPVERQRAFIWTLNDPETQKFFEQFLEAQRATFDEKIKAEAQRAAPKRGDFIKTIAAEPGDESLFEANAGHLSKEVQSMDQRLQVEFPGTKGMPLSERLHLAQRLYRHSAAE